MLVSYIFMSLITCAYCLDKLKGTERKNTWYIVNAILFGVMWPLMLVQVISDTFEKQVRSINKSKK